MTDEKIKHAKKSAGFYREVWRQTMCGYTNAQIAGNLKTALPTVRRAQKRMRHTGSATTAAAANIDRPLYAAARHYKLAHFLAWDRFIAVLRLFYAGGQDVPFAKLHECMMQCPSRLTPGKFRTRHLQFHPYYGRHYTINMVVPKTSDALAAELSKFERCRYCPMGRHRLAFFMLFDPCPQIFMVLMFYLSRFRIRNMDEFELMMLYKEASAFGMIHDIVLTIGQQRALEGMDFEQAMPEIEAAFLNITDQVFDEILRGL